MPCNNRFILCGSAPTGCCGQFVPIDITPVPPGGGAIAGFESGLTPVVLTTLASGLVSTGTVVGQASAASAVSLAGLTIDLSALTVTPFVAPRSGVITALSAFFTGTAGVTFLGTTATVTATVYKAPVNSNVYSPTTATVTLSPSYVNGIAIGQNSSGVANASVPVAVGERLVVVFSTTVAGILGITVLTGFASADITLV